MLSAKGLDLAKQCFGGAHEEDHNGINPILQWGISQVRACFFCGKHPVMRRNGIKSRLEQLSKDYPGGMKGLSLAAKLGETAVRDIIQDRNKSPAAEAIVALAVAAGVSPGWLAFGEGGETPKIPIQGIVSAGDGWTMPDDCDLDVLEFSVSGSDLFAIEVRGDSMFPVYRDGEVLVCSRFRGPHLDNLIGLDCAVLTLDGKGYVKLLKRGRRAGRYTLKSYNLTTDDIDDVSLQWAAPIVWVRRKSV